MSDQDRRIARFGDLNVLGKTVFLGGAVIRLTANLIDKAVDRAVDIVIDTEKAYRQGRDPNVEEAKIIEERRDQPPR